MNKESAFIQKLSHLNALNWKILYPIIAFWSILILGIWFRFYDISNESYWIDEMSTVVEGQQSLNELFVSGRLDQPLGYYVPFHFWIELFGPSEASARAFSAISGIGSIILLYLIGKELFNKPIGLLSAFLMAISEYQVYYSQQARFYSYFGFITLLSFLFFVLSLKRGNAAFFLFYSFSNIVLMYSHTYGVFLIAAQGLYFLLFWKNHKKHFVAFLFSQIIMLLAVTPYFLTILLDNSGVAGTAYQNIGGLAKPSLLDPIRSIYRFILSARGDRTWETMLINYLAAGTVFIFGVGISFFRQKWSNANSVVKDLISNFQEIPGTSEKLTLIISWLLFPILVPVVISIAYLPIYQDRYLIGASPALYLLLAFFFYIFRKAIPIAVTLVTISIMIGPSLFYYYEKDVHEQWRESANYIYENAGPNDVIVFAPNQGIGVEQKTFNWYFQGQLQNYGLSSSLTEPNEILEVLSQFTQNHSRLWVVIRDNPNGSSERYTFFFIDQSNKNMQLVKTQVFTGITIFLFELSDN